jgi:murein L,D-transpeptidase YcbB/YkuD
VLKAILTTLVIFAIGWSAFGATPAKPRKRHHRAATTSATPVKRSAKTGAATTTKAAAHRKGKSRRPSRSYQQAPSPERYKEIQQALASKGYLQTEATGEWGPESVDALKRFQTDQNLMPDGKITSLSLIALGLGPKRLTAKSDPAPPQPGTTTLSAPAPNQ